MMLEVFRLVKGKTRMAEGCGRDGWAQRGDSGMQRNPVDGRLAACAYWETTYSPSESW